MKGKSYALRNQHEDENEKLITAMPVYERILFCGSVDFVNAKVYMEDFIFSNGI